MLTKKVYAEDDACRTGEDGKRRLDPESVQRSKLRIETRLKLLACWSKRYNPQSTPATTVNLGVSVALTDERREELMEKRRAALEE